MRATVAPNTAGPTTSRGNGSPRVPAGTKEPTLRLISKMTILSRLPIAAILILPIQAQVTTSQYDNARTGANLNETTLTPQNVNAARFGKLFTLQADGDIYAQPLYLPGVEIPGKGKHNVVFIGTEHHSVFAFDADGQPSTPLWQASFLTGDSVRPVPASAAQCPFIRPEIGITPTPVIDRATGTLFVLARTKESQGVLQGSRYVQRLHALAVTDRKST